jgi:transposase-like protein
MKTLAQVLEQQVHQSLRKRIRMSTQPGAVLNVLEGEISTFLSEVINQRLKQEQEEFLQRVPYQRSADRRYRNGFKTVRIKGFVKSLFVKKPVLRLKTPSYFALEVLRKFGKGLLASLASRFWLRGASTRAVAQELNQTFGTKLSATDISNFSRELLPDVQAWLSRPVPQDIAYLFLDAIYLPVRKPGFTSKQALLGAVGMTPQGNRHVLGFLLGDCESEDSWSALTKDLLDRGLNRSALKLVISDEHKAIVSTVEKTLGVTHQLCVIHKMRNSLSRVASKHRKAFYADFTAIFWADSRELALVALGKLQEKWSSVYPKAVQVVANNIRAFLHFFDHQKHLWTILRSTNLIERFNREIRRRLNPAGAIASESELWKLLWSVSTNQEAHWVKRKLRNVKDLRKEVAAVA